MFDTNYRHLRRIGAPALMILLFPTLLMDPRLSMAQSGTPSLKAEKNYQSIVDQIKLTEIQLDVQKFEGFGSRLTGYKGYEKAASYIYDRFVAYGLTNITSEYYNLTVPTEYYATITPLPSGEPIKAYALWPNLIETSATPPQGIEGKLVYVGDGEPKNYREKVEGSIVLMDFDSWDNWLYAAQFGAKAVIFIEKEITRFEAQLKFLDIPLDFPRLYVDKTNGELLLSLLGRGELRVNVDSLMVYGTSKVKNIVGYILGSDTRLKNETVVISAYYDSYSVVPSLAPGAEEAVGIATLLEYAKFYGKPENRPKRTIMFIALSGHHFALAGSRELVYNHFNDVGGRLKLWVNLDLNTQTNGMGVFSWSRFYAYSSVIGRYGAVRQKILGEYKPMIEEELGRKYDAQDFMLNFFDALVARGLSESEPFYVDSEPFSLAGGLGISFRTVGALRPYHGTPYDTFEKLRFENLVPQVEFIICILTTLLNDAQISWPDLTPNISDPSEGGFATLVGRVVEYNRAVAWYTGVPRALVVIYTPSMGDLGLLGYPIIVQADDDGYYFVRGVEHLYSYPPGSRLVASNVIEAYVDEPTHGPVDYAPDYGKYAVYPSRHIVIDLPQKFVNVVVFKCGTLSILGMINPRGVPLTILNLDIRIFGTDQTPDFYGYVHDAPNENVMVFGEPGKSIEIAMRSIEVEPFGVLTNSTPEVPEGFGFEMQPGRSIVANTFQIAWDTFYLDEARVREIERWSIPSSGVDTHNLTGNYLTKAIDALRSSPPDYEVFLSKAIQALSTESSAYVEVKTTIKDTIDTILFFYVLLIPFALIAEGLIKGSENPLKKTIYITTTFSLFSLAFYFLHVGFHIAFNVYMTLIGFILVVLVSPTVVLLFSNLISALKGLREELIGVHFAGISRGGAFLAAASLGIQNMRRRRFRTILSLVSVILIVFSMIAFSSMFSIKVTKPVVMSGETGYNGIFMRETLPTLPPLPKSIKDVTYASIRSGLIVRRIEIRAGRPMIFTSKSGGTFQAKALIGLETSEAEVTGLDNALIRGTWLPLESTSKVCIIPDEAAEQLKVDVGDDITLYGIELKVIGIFDSEAYGSIVDLDQGMLTPALAMALGARTHSSPAATIIVPYGFASGLSTNRAYTMAIKLSDPDAIIRIAKELSSVFPGVLLYVSVTNGEVISFYSEEQVTLSGWQMMIIPLVMSSLITFNMLLGSVYERVREITILSSVGLSPKHVLGVFLIEPVIYAIISAVLGYVLGLTGNSVLGFLNLKEFIANTASSWVIVAVSSSIIPMLLPSLYVAYRSSKLVTPSLERAWKITTKPIGDEWTIPLPFVVKAEELNGVLAYMKEYFQAHSSERAGVFWIRDLQYLDEKRGSTQMKLLKMITRLAPYDAGLEQESELAFLIEREAAHINVEIHLKRISGILRVWKNTNRMYVDAVRKQLLVWRSLRVSDKERYLRTRLSDMI